MISNPFRYCVKCLSAVDSFDSYIGRCPWCHLTKAGIVPAYYERSVGGQSDNSPMPNNIVDVSMGKRVHTIRFRYRTHYINDGDKGEDNPWRDYAVRVWEDEEAKEEMCCL